MKNIKRIILLIALVFFATKIISSDFSFAKSENRFATIIKK